MVTAAGEMAPSHVINLGYASFAELEAYGDPLPNDPDFKTFQAALAKCSTRLGEYVRKRPEVFGSSQHEVVRALKLDRGQTCVWPSSSPDAADELLELAGRSSRQRAADIRKVQLERVAERLLDMSN